MSTREPFNNSTRSVNDSIDDPANETTDIALERAWKEASDQLPPMAVDSAILTRARQEVAAPARRFGFLPRSWFAPLATGSVALLVIGVSTGLLKQSDVPDSMEQFSEVELASRTDTVAGVTNTAVNDMRSAPRAAAPVLMDRSESTLERKASVSSGQSFSVTQAQPSEIANAVSDTRVAAAISTNASGAPQTEAGAIASAAATAAASPERKVYQKPALKRRAKSATERREASLSEDAIENPLIARINSARALDGRFVDSRLVQLFVTDKQWFDMLSQLVTQGHVELATELAGKFTLLRPTSLTPQELASLFARSAEQVRAKAAQSVN